MNDILRERLIRKLDTLPEEKIYQILDYIDFLESKYAPKLSTAPNPLKRFAEGVEDTLRAGRVSAGAQRVFNAFREALERIWRCRKLRGVLRFQKIDVIEDL